MEYSVTYKQNSNLVSSLRMPNASEDSQMSVIDYTYDNFERLTEKVISMSSMVDLSEEYSYYTYTDADGERHTTSLVSSITLRSSNASGYDVVYSYVYDNLGNITDVYIEGIPVESYEYDSLGQLIRENNVLEDYTKLYEYDKAGNIRYTSVMPYTSAPSANIAFAEGSILPYGYSISAWGDLLTSYGGTSISYDAIGNPTNWRNANYLTWKARELQSLSVTGGPSVAFEHNSDGIRTKKTVGGSVTHNYVLDGTKIIRETVTGGGNSYTLYYLYDTSGSVQGFIYNNSYYYFQKNLQGDVVRILDYSGNVVVEYTYDAWGKVLSVTGSQASTIGQYNPFRYRSYYYDVETGLYYVSSRYYDPEIGRFINADGFVSTGQDITGYNMFAYCGNNPVNRVDPTGQFWEELWDAFTQTIQQASGYFAVAAGVSQADTPAPGPADVVSGVLLLGGVLVCAGIATYTAITTPAPSISIPKAEEKADAIPAPPPSSTVIYRYGGTNPGNLTPKAKDKYSGLSFSTVPMPGAAVTTIEALNATGVVYAVQDGPTHVSVRPVGATMEDWINAGSGSIWTQAVKSVVIKWDGGY